MSSEPSNVDDAANRTFVDAPAVFTDAEATYEDAPSREDLLKRAAALGPARQTWASIVLTPSDPILADKMLPRVRERRARFRRIVKVTLGACAAFCIFVTAVGAFSSSNASAASSASLHRTTAATAVVPVEKLDMPTRGKASSHATAAVRPTSTPRTWGWGAKRR